MVATSGVVEVVWIGYSGDGWMEEGEGGWVQEGEGDVGEGLAD